MIVLGLIMNAIPGNMTIVLLLWAGHTQDQFLTPDIYPQCQLSVVYLANKNSLSISLSAGKWSIPTTTGPRPPPCSNFTFTAVSDHLAVLFGGGRRGRTRVSDWYLMDFQTMVCTDVFCVQHMPH